MRRAGLAGVSSQPGAAGEGRSRRYVIRGISMLAAGAMASQMATGKSLAGPGPAIDVEVDPLSIHKETKTVTAQQTSVQLDGNEAVAFVAYATGTPGLVIQGGVLGANTEIAGSLLPVPSFGVGGNDGRDQSNGAGVFGMSGGGVGVLGTGLGAGSVGVRAKAPSGTALDVIGTSTFSGPAVFADQVQAAKFKGSGHLLVSLNASNLALGTVPDERLSADIPRLSAGVPESALPRTVALTDRPNNAFKGQVVARVFAGAPRKGGAPAFATAGTATIAKGQDRVSVTTAALKRGVSVLATLQNLAGAGVAVAGVEKHAGGFDIVLTAPAEAKTQVAYFLFRQG